MPWPRRELREAITALRDDPAVGAIVITGAGEKSFVAGTDIEELAALNRKSGEAFSRGGQEVFDLIEQCGKPVIAAVNGYALGGGCELALACTLRIASDQARFGQPEVNLGVIPGYGGTQRLPRLIGEGRALEMMLTGTPVGAEEALRIGLVNTVVPHAELPAATERMARMLAGKSRPAVRLILEAVRASGEETPGRWNETGSFVVRRELCNRGLPGGCACLPRKTNCVIQGTMKGTTGISRRTRIVIALSLAGAAIILAIVFISFAPGRGAEPPSRKMRGQSALRGWSVRARRRSRVRRIQGATECHSLPADQGRERECAADGVPAAVAEGFLLRGVQSGAEQEG